MTQVQVRDGSLEGELVESEYGDKYYSFKGIPYAEPPVDDLRFKAPQPVKPWDEVYSAKKFGVECYQRDVFDGSESRGGEECLYLNVYTPEIQPSSPLPVMVWIHGGGFQWGSGNDNVYAPDFLIRQGVILVTFNYRVGVLGFLSLDTEEVPGNAGMKDQVMALKWVKNNISSFGGDPENITIFGEGSGGVSVSFHLISPMSKGLFKRAIAQSGAANCSWATPFAAREKALVLARQLDCHSEDDKDLYEFFKNHEVFDFIDIDLCEIQNKRPSEFDFGVVSEKDFGQERFFYGDVFDALRNGIHEGVEIMTGFNEHEGTMAVAVAAMAGKFENVVFGAANFVETFVPKHIALERPMREQLEIGRKIKNYFIKNGPPSAENYQEVLNFIHCDFAISDMVEWAKFCSQNNTVYLYKFTCKSERNQMAKILNVEEIAPNSSLTSHGDDLFYLFNSKILDQKVDIGSDTFKIIDNVTKLWTNFAKFGNPTPDDSLAVQWVPYSIENQDYLDIGNQLTSGNAPNKEDVEFWEGIYRAYLPKCVV